jgi:hypothetical protein
MRRSIVLSLSLQFVFPEYWTFGEAFLFLMIPSSKALEKFYEIFVYYP